eukprot:UN4824
MHKFRRMASNALRTAPGPFTAGSAQQYRLQSFASKVPVLADCNGGKLSAFRYEVDQGRLEDSSGGAKSSGHLRDLTPIELSLTTQCPHSAEDCFNRGLLSQSRRPSSGSGGQVLAGRVHMRARTLAGTARAHAALARCKHAARLTAGIRPRLTLLAFE